MNEQRAKLMLEETFRSHFDKDNFVQFIKELFNKFEEHRIECRNEEVQNEFQEFIDSYTLFGEYTDSEGKSIDVLAVKLLKNNPESARTMQRNFIARYLAQKNADAALVAFYGEEIDNWRFSFVKLEYHLEKDEKGNVKPATNLTPPKRYSFLVGKTEPSHTAQSRFLELLIKEDSNPKVSEVESSFSVEKVTKEFFERYKELFLELEESLNKIVKQNEALAKEFNEKGISTPEFTKKLLGQIVFIYFLQKKGWLGIEKDETGKFKEWGSGHKDFLKKLYKKDIIDYNNFFNDILEPLFYEALARDRENDYYSRFKCKVPFLNGGLFEPLGGYNWTDTDILIDNKIFGRILETFDLYNFTVKEDEPLEKEVAIDPEMLGKVFENLLEVKDRKSKGSYYTPREIVYYMCQKSIINYLETRTGIEKKHIDNFIYNGDISDGQIKENKDAIDGLLKDIKVVDPAIGSGAFPVGMMMEIIKARATLTELFPKEKQAERTIYNFKRECIEDSLYGVDIDPGAVDIAQLRLWLSLIVDETDIHKIKPLPNLDYKIMCGNSLLDEFEGVKLFDERLLGEAQKIDYSVINDIDEKIKRLYKELGDIQTGKKKDGGLSKGIKKEINKLKRKKQELTSIPKKEGTYGSLFEVKKIKESQKKLTEIKALHKQFFNENNRREKIRLKEDIEKRDWEFIEETLKEEGNEGARKKLEQIKKTRSKPFFLWKLYFSDVFQENGGFDIVIANPPYVRVDDIDADMRDLYKKNYISAKGKYDLYYLFFERAMNISSKSGVFVFITPNKYCAADSGYSLREILFSKHSNKIEIISTSKLNIFESASNYPVISIFQRGIVTDSFVVREAIALNWQGLKSSKNSYSISFLDYEKLPDRVIPINTSQKSINLIIKLCSNKKTLGNVLSISEGLRIPKDYEEESDKFLPIVKQYQFSRYSQIKAGTFINKYHFLDICPESSDRYNKIMRKKILIAEDALQISATLDVEKMIPQGGVYFAISSSNLDIKYLLGIINSKLLSTLYEILYAGMHMGGGYLRYRSKFLESIPIPFKLLESSQNNQTSMITLIDKILSAYNNGDNADSKATMLDNEVNRLVYKLYELTPEEIELIEGFHKEEYNIAR